MTLAESVANISTQYQKVAHLESVTYTIFTLDDQRSVEQILLELELRIRYEHPRILLAYTNKCLYYFQFGHWKTPRAHDSEQNIKRGQIHEADLKLGELYPQLATKLENTVPIEKLAYPMSSSKKHENTENTGVEKDENFAYACLSFLKAVKKSVVYNLSSSGKMYMFGNCVICRVSETSSQYVITQVDPVLLGNGDLLVSMTQRSTLPLFHSSVLNLDHINSEFVSCFVIYVVPSGLRCHLYDSSDLASSFTRTPPKFSDTLLNLLKSSTGVDLTEKQSILWVKLIPNLQHLNNQTSDISRFVHDVDNRKYILWPWELCILQFGSVETDKPMDTSENLVDPLSLVNEYMAFSLRKASSIYKPEGISCPSSQIMNDESEPGLDSAFFQNASSTSDPNLLKVKKASKDVESKKIEPNKALNKVESHIITPIEKTNVDFSDSKSIQNLQLPEITEPDKDEVPLHHISDKRDADEKDLIHDDDTDLFGESSDSEAQNSENQGKSKDFSLDNGPSYSSEYHSPDTASNLQRDKKVTMDLENKKDVVQKDMGKEIESDTDSVVAYEPSYMGIPKSEMISAEIRQFSPISYDDPGAPPPLVPTPAIFHQNTIINSHGLSSPVLPHAQLTAFHGKNKMNTSQPSGRRSSEPAAGWSFTPIAFNPKIKHNIDAKYGKGGKFYVDTEDSSGPDLEPRKARHRETSAQIYDESVKLDSLSRVCSSEIRIVKDNSIRPVSHEDLPEESDTTHEEDHDMLSSDGDNDAEEDNVEEEENEEMEDAESDEDEEQLQPNQSFSGSNLSSESKSIEPNALIIPHFYPDTSSAHISPVTSRPKYRKDHSPFGLGVDSSVYSVSPMPAELRSAPHIDFVPSALEMVSITAESQPETDTSPKQTLSAEPEVSNTPTSNTSSSSGVSESSNCLPLILRSINVQTIPSIFLLRKFGGGWGVVSINRDFDMEDDDEDDDLHHKDTCLYTKKKNLGELLNWLIPTLVFDSGFTNLESHVQLKLPDFCTESVELDVTDGSCSALTTDTFTQLFPSSQIVTLDEFLGGGGDVDKFTMNFKESEHYEDMTSRLFSDKFQLDLCADEPLKFWDSFMGTPKREHPHRLTLDQGSVFLFDEIKMKARKNSTNLINFNSLGSRFWKYLNLEPVNGPKSFQVLMVTESLSDDENFFFNPNPVEFLDSIILNYAQVHFGQIKKLNIQKFENRLDLDGVNNGILAIEKGFGVHSRNTWYKQVNRKLKNLAELIKLDIINRTNKFDFDRPLLLLFVDFDETASSVLQVSKLCRNFKVCLRNHQLSLVHVFAHVIPSSSIYKSASSRLKYLSDFKLSKISKLLYNKCPNTAFEQLLTHDEEEPRKLFSVLVKDAPSTLQFKLFNRSNNDGLNNEGNDDMFLHVAYERSADKNWICAAWSSPLGTVTQLKSWYCPPAAKDGFNEDVHDLASIIFKIWDVSANLFKKLSDDLSQRTSGLGKKRYLVLTRVSSIIPDDELLYWKRLTAKYKDTSLIVVTTNRAPKYVFNSILPANSGSPVSEDFQFVKKKNDSARDISDFDQSVEPFPTYYNSASPTNSMPMSTSPLNAGLSLRSPQQFANVPSGLFFSYDGRGDHFNDEHCTLRDTTSDFVGIIPKVTLPSCNSPTRFSMRTGYIMKRATHAERSIGTQFIVFEVSLLSCSNHWNLDIVMKIILKQFRKLGALNELLGIYDDPASTDCARSRKNELQTLVPWHINAVVKALDYLVHVHVGE